MKHRIGTKFRQLGLRDESALIPFVVAGDPVSRSPRRWCANSRRAVRI